MDMILQKTVICLILLAGSVLSQETHAEGKGTAIVEVQNIEYDEFLNMQDQWRDSVSWYVSQYCKLGEDHCWATDKQIRRYDIVIQTADVVVGNVHVTFHIRDRFDHDRAGLERHQTRRAFEKYGSEMGDLFGKEMRVIDPVDDGMEPWLIAVIAVCSAIGAALIITVAVLGAKSCEERRKRELHEELIKERVKEEYLEFSKVTEKENPGYGSDSDIQPSSSRHSSNNQPPPYNNVSMEAEDMKGTTGEYSIIGAFNEAGLNEFPKSAQEDLIESTKI